MLLPKTGRRITDGIADAWAEVMFPEPAPRSDSNITLQAQAAAPVVWMLGKVQSGKSSIVKALTNATALEVGSGYRPCTRTSSIFDLPPEAPVIRFLDTRGLGETNYDPAEDLAFCEGSAQLLIVTVRAADQELSSLTGIVAAIRRRHPDWPVVVAQTALHDTYPGGHDRHVMPYPFQSGDPSAWSDAGVPNPLIRSLQRQRKLFSALPGRGAIEFAALDLTLPGDGLEPADYGLDALMRALTAVAPSAVTAILRDLQSHRSGPRQRHAHAHILGFSSAAAAADIFPVAGLVAVPAVQAKLLHGLALIYGVDWDRRTLTEFAGCLGAGTVARMASSFGLRELAKLIPVYGQTAGTAAAAAASFATTYALGKAACYFFERRQSGETTPEGVATEYAAALREAFKLDKERHRDRSYGESPA